MPLVFYAQVGLAMITLARLMFSVPNPWTPDLPPMHGILDRLARNLDMAMDASALAEGKDVRNTRLAQWAAWVRILEGAVMADASTGAGGVAAAAQAMGGAAAVAQAMGGAAAVASLVGGDAGDVGGRGIAPTVGALYNTPPMERGSGDPAAAAAAMTALASGTAGLGGGGGMGGMIQPEPELLETDWTALLDDMCGYGLFGYSDDGALQGVLNGYDGTVTM